MSTEPKHPPGEPPEEFALQYFKGVGERRAQLFANLGIRTVRDLLYHFPRGYEDRTQFVRIGKAALDADACLQGEIIAVQYRRLRSAAAKTCLEVFVGDDTGVVCATWFNARRDMAANFAKGEKIALFGRVSFYNQLQMVAPDYAVGDEPDPSLFGIVLPIYPSTEGLSQNAFRGVMRQALDRFVSGLPEIFPPEYLKRRRMPSLEWAVRRIHFPESFEVLDRARRRLAFEEMFVFQTALAIRRQRVKDTDGLSFAIGPNVDRRIRRLFDFQFTPAQERTVAEIVEDMRSSRPMHRLLQGDVGCGKTAVAAYAMLAALADPSRQCQAALMAPTEILAEQHYLTFSRLLANAKLDILLLRGGATAAERRANLEAVRDGRAQLVIGTHALIQKDVEFKNLALVVIDEQHRFGVRQRLTLSKKGARPELLIMTATPIPRSLSMVFFGDLDISVIDQMPPGRRPIETRLYPSARWDEAFEFAAREMAAGRQVYVVYPLVEESETLDLTSAREGFEALSKGVFKDYPCALLHGQMPQQDKEQTMEDFRAGRYRGLIATTVIEVGIDVRNASTMIIQHAERLGLSQLHQLRGRVGRGPFNSYCLLLADARTEESRERLKVIVDTSDGFKIAEEDLRLRGPGQFFGTRQSGMPDLQLLDVALDTRLFEKARKEAFAIVAADPDLTAPSHHVLRDAILARFSDTFHFGEIG